MNSNYHLDIQYIAGLFDGEGCITYKKYKEKKKNGTYDCWRINMEIAMRSVVCVQLHIQLDVTQCQSLLLASFSTFIFLHPWWSLLPAHILVILNLWRPLSYLSYSFKRWLSLIIHNNIMMLQNSSKINSCLLTQPQRLLNLFESSFPWVWIIFESFTILNYLLQLLVLSWRKNKAMTFTSYIIIRFQIKNVRSSNICVPSLLCQNVWMSPSLRIYLTRDNGFSLFFLRLVGWIYFLGTCYSFFIFLLFWWLCRVFLWFWRLGIGGATA